MAKKKSAARSEVYQEIFPPVPSKSDKRRREIIEGAIEAYAGINFEHLSYDDIAKPAETSRRLVQHYFPEKNELFAISMRVIRSQYQAIVVEALNQESDPKLRFCEYIRAAVAWPETYPKHVHAWFLYYLVCAQQPKLRKLHEELAALGEARISGMVTDAFPKRKFTDQEKRFIAKSIQRIITGALIEICSEATSPDIQRVQDEAVKAALSIVG